ncbi:hypothetical protein GGX14DRAFT_565920 [Mycena pura]|uniref:Uncharacterized protein n=1 Tax=Mycena pura TaxID=153505 RepID=A0AAD6VDV0_9AGAR|nr:hypothetical protein GGX14DRAFT_565920 [Mycena pura]
MLSTRLITFVVASVATLTLGNTVPSVNTTAPKVNGMLTAGTCGPPPVPWTFILACLNDNYSDCDAVPVVTGGCAQMPARQINAMSSVQIPCGWVCTFYNTDATTTVNGCDLSTAVSITTLMFPGSSALVQEAFDNVVDFVQCNTDD